MTRRVLLLASLLLTTLAGMASPQEPSPIGDVYASTVLGAPNGVRRSGDVLDAMTKDVASLLRCPVCQGSSAWDSPATMAVNMKAQARELLAEGYDREQVLQYFKSSYGDFVLLVPPKQGIGLLVWMFPAVLLVAGSFVVWRFMANARAAVDPQHGIAEMATMAPPGRETLPPDPELAQYVRTVRELAYDNATPVHVQTTPITER